MPLFRRIRVMSNETAIWIAQRSGDHPSKMQHGPEADGIPTARKRTPVLHNRQSFSAAKSRAGCGSVRGSEHPRLVLFRLSCVYDAGLPGNKMVNCDQCFPSTHRRSAGPKACLVNFDQSASPLLLNTKKRHTVPVDENIRLEPTWLDQPSWSQTRASDRSGPSEE